MIEQEGTTEATYAPYMWLPPLVMLRAAIWLCMSAAVCVGSYDPTDGSFDKSCDLTLT